MFIAIFSLSTIRPLDEEQRPFSFDGVRSYSSDEMLSPGDWIKESNVMITDDKVIIDIPNATWARFTDTNSMDPVIDIGANSIEIRPPSKESLKVGDIISYSSEYIDGLVIHRIVDIKEDQKGTYFITRGDNNNVNDPQRVRFDQIKGVVIGILY